MNIAINQPGGRRQGQYQDLAARSAKKHRTLKKSSKNWLRQASGQTNPEYRMVEADIWSDQP